MKVFIRIRIVLLALIVLGSFANFAQNAWGNVLITVCEALVSLAFIIDGIFHLKNRLRIGKSYAEGSFYECMFLGLLFLGFVFRNMWWPGTSLILIACTFALTPFYCIQIIKFYRNNVGKGRILVTLLTVGSITTLILGLSIVFKIMHWPFATLMYYVGFGLTLIMMAGSAKWTFDYDHKKINVISALSLLKNNIILLYFLTFSISTFGIMAAWGYAPKFYSQKLPQAVEIEREKGKNNSQANLKAEEMAINYFTFEEECYKNGFLE